MENIHRNDSTSQALFTCTEEDTHRAVSHDIENEPLQFVTLVCRNREQIRCSREKLANVSDFFRAMLFGNFREKRQEEIKLEYVDAELMKLLLGFYAKTQSNSRKYDEPYFSRIFIKNRDSAWSLIEIADMLGLEEAAAECDSYIIQTRNQDNPLAICQLARKFSRFSILKEVVRDWIVTKQEQPKMPSVYVDNKTIGTANDHCDLNSNCMDGYREQFESKDFFYVIGGYYWEQFRDCFRISCEQLIDSSSTKSRDQKRDKNFESMRPYPGKHNEECRVVVLDTDIYISGGFDEKAKPIREVWRYDTRSDRWSRVSDMRHERFYHCAFATSGHVFVCGGYDENFVLDTLEKYYPFLNEWVGMANMLTGVGNAAHASDESALYVACGQFGYKETHTTNQVQHYAVTVDQWTMLTTYQSPVFYPHSEYGLCGVVAEGRLFIVGGQTERCDTYDIKAGEWKRISNMCCRRMEADVIYFREKLYVCGGYDYQTGTHHDTVEEYDTEKDSWRIMPVGLPRPSRSLGFCHIFDVERIS